VVFDMRIVYVVISLCELSTAVWDGEVRDGREEWPFVWFFPPCVAGEG